MERVSGPDDPRVAEYRDIAEPSLVRSRGLFVAEGRLVVRRLIEDGRYTLRSVLVNDAAALSLEPVFERLGGRVPIHRCDAGVFLGLTGHHIHRGCLALVERPAALTLEGVLEASPRLVIVLEGVTNADNVGGVFRNAAALGAGGVLLSPTCCDPLYRKAIRTSMAATLHVPFARVEDWPRGLEALRARGFTIAALSPREPAILLDGFAASSTRPHIALLVGTEGEGLTPQAEGVADVRVRIPISSAVDSLNLAVAVGIALHRLSVRL